MEICVQPGREEIRSHASNYLLNLFEVWRSIAEGEEVEGGSADVGGIDQTKKVKGGNGSILYSGSYGGGVQMLEEAGQRRRAKGVVEGVPLLSEEALRSG